MVPRRRKKVRGHQSTTWRCLFVTRAGSFVTVLLIVGLIVGTVPTGALAAALVASGACARTPRR